MEKFSRQVQLQCLLDRLEYYRGKNPIFWKTELCARLDRYDPPPEIALQFVALRSVASKFKGEEAELDIVRRNLNGFLGQLSRK